MRNDGLAGVHRREEIDRHLRHHVRGAQFLDSARVGGARVVDQAIDAAELAVDAIDRGSERVAIRDVDGERSRGFAEPLAGLGQRHGVASQDRNPRPAPHQTRRRGEPDVARAARDDHDLAGERTAHAGMPTVFVCRYSSNPSTPISRPMPLCR